MRPRNYPERPVLDTAVIQMEPNRDTLLQEFDRRLAVRNAFLFRPVAEPGRFPSLPQSDLGVLMPPQSPIRLRRLIENDPSDRPDDSTEHFFRQASQPRICGKLLADLSFQERPCSRFGTQVRNRLQDFSDFPNSKHTRDYRKALCGNLAA